MKPVLVVAFAILVVLFPLSCGKGKGSGIKVGGIYSVDTGKGNIGVVKVLVLEGEIVHIRIYKNRFTQRPASINPDDLSLGSIKDTSGGFGIGHIPVETETFLSWQPRLIMETPVKEEELEGYKIWKNETGKAREK